MIYRNKTPNPSPLVAESHSDITPEQNDAMPLLAKIPDLTFDIDRLQWCMKNIVLKHEPFWAGGPTEKRPMRKYGGWSLTSSTGEIYNGWQTVNGWKDNKFHLDLAFKNGYMPKWFHNKRTPICVDYFAEVMDQLEGLGFYPHAVRIWVSPAGGHHIAPHTDGADNAYCVRLHIPIISNPGCIHEWYADPEDYKVNIPADGSAYMFRTNIWHDTYNHGDTDRYHFIAEVYDTKHIVRGYGYDHIARVEANAKKTVKLFTGRDM